MRMNRARKQKLLGAVLVAGLAVGLVVVVASRSQRPPGRANRAIATRSNNTVPIQFDDSSALRRPVALPKEIAPWDVTREHAPPIPSGHEPAWAVAPPRPDPGETISRQPAALPNPALHPPRGDNPGGLNGD